MTLTGEATSVGSLDRCIINPVVGTTLPILDESAVALQVSPLVVRGAFSSHSHSTPVTGSYQGFTGLRYLGSMRTRAVLTYKIKEHPPQYFFE